MMAKSFGGGHWNVACSGARPGAQGFGTLGGVGVGAEYAFSECKRESPQGKQQNVCISELLTTLPGIEEKARSASGRGAFMLSYTRRAAGSGVVCEKGFQEINFLQSRIMSVHSLTLAKVSPLLSPPRAAPLKVFDLLDQLGKVLAHKSRAACRWV